MTTSKGIYYEDWFERSLVPSYVRSKFTNNKPHFNTGKTKNPSFAPNTLGLYE